MADELMLEIVTPEKVAFNGKVEEVTIPGAEGEFGVLLGHAALLSAVKYGELNYTKENKKTYYAINTGYAEVTAHKVIVLVETAERSDAIDAARAIRAKDVATEKLSKMSKDDPDFKKTEKALERAEIRLKIVEKAS
jgi:F-type H+-transporting ATPase subunit epsilon